MLERRVDRRERAQDDMPALNRHRRYSHAQVMQLIAEDRRRRPMQPLPRNLVADHVDLVVARELRDAAHIPEKASHMYAIQTIREMREVYREYRHRPTLWQRILDRLGI